MQKIFSYPLTIDELNQNQRKFILSADTDELADIKQILQVEDVKSFYAEIFLKMQNKEHLLHVWGSVNAELVIKSVITLENFAQTVATPFEIFYDTQATYKDIRELEAQNRTDIPDIIENGTINLADIAIEQVALQLDDYPRAAGEVFDFAQFSTATAAPEENPFTILQKLKK